MKKFIKNLTKVLLTLSFLLCIHGNLHTLPQQDSQIPFSEEDIKLLEEAQKKVTEYVENLPTEDSLRARGFTPEQIANMDTKDKFDREVKRLSEMSEEELVKEIEKAIEEVTKAQTSEAKPEFPSANIIQEEVAKPELKPKVTIPSNKQLVLLQLIDSLIASIENFLRKAQMMVELPSKIQNWHKEGKLIGWPATLNWNTFKAQIEELETKLTKLKDRDPRTQNYRYLEDLLKDESLVNNITKVRDSLNRYEPRIELSPFGIDKMSSEARQATRSALLVLHEAVGILAIPSTLDKIFEKYEPTAKRIKESEEAAKRHALEESRKPRAAGSVNVVGREPYYMPRHYEGTRPSSGSVGLFDQPLRSDKDKSSSITTQGDPAQKAGEAKKAEEKKTEAAKHEADKSADRYEAEFNNALDSFKDLFDEHLKGMEKHIEKDIDHIPDEAMINAVKNSNQALRKAISETKKLKKQFARLKDDQKKAYKKAFKDTFKDAKHELDKTIEQINNLAKPNKALLTARLNPTQQKIYQVKMYSYFNKKNEPELIKYINDARARLAPGADLIGTDKQIENLLKTSTVDFSDLKVKIQELKKVVDDL